MPSNIEAKLYLGDILISTGAGDCGACVNINNSFVTFDNSNIDFNINVLNSVGSFSPSTIDYDPGFTSSVGSFGPSNIDFDFSVSLYSGVSGLDL